MREFGADAAWAYIALLELLHRDYGYYIPYGNESERENCVYEVLQSFIGGKYCPKPEKIAGIIESLAACELFNPDRLPEIITSKREQAAYYRATVERKAIDIIDCYWLLSEPEMASISTKHCYYVKLYFDRKTRLFPR